MSFLQINKINKCFDGNQVLNDINIDLNKGDFFSLLGPSGCGKTTLLRILAGLEQPDKGTVILSGNDITSVPVQKRNFGFVFQNYALFPHMTVFQNVSYALKIKKTSEPIIKKKVADILTKLLLIDKINTPVSLLSGGEQQRVSLARVIITEPSLILLDEPLSNLDYTLRIEARNELKRLQKEIGITTLYVTHDQSEALALSDKIAVFNKGNLMQTGNPKEIYYNPTCLFSASFVGHYNIFNQTEAKNIFNQFIPDGKLLAVLPEHLLMKKNQGKGIAKITADLFSGSFIEYTITVEQKLWKAILPSDNDSGFNSGDNVYLSVSIENLKILDIENG